MSERGRPAYTSQFLKRLFEAVGNNGVYAYQIYRIYNGVRSTGDRLKKEIKKGKIRYDDACSEIEHLSPEEINNIFFIDTDEIYINRVRETALIEYEKGEIKDANEVLSELEAEKEEIENEMKENLRARGLTELPEHVIAEYEEEEEEEIVTKTTPTTRSAQEKLKRRYRYLSDKLDEVNYRITEIKNVLRSIEFHTRPEALELLDTLRSFCKEETKIYVKEPSSAKASYNSIWRMCWMLRKLWFIEAFTIEELDPVQRDSIIPWCSSRKCNVEPKSVRDEDLIGHVLLRLTTVPEDSDVHPESLYSNPDDVWLSITNFYNLNKHIPDVSEHKVAGGVVRGTEKEIEKRVEKAREEMEKYLRRTLKEGVLFAYYYIPLLEQKFSKDELISLKYDVLDILKKEHGLELRGVPQIGTGATPFGAPERYAAIEERIKRKIERGEKITEYAWIYRTPEEDTQSGHVSLGLRLPKKYITEAVITPEVIEINIDKAEEIVERLSEAFGECNMIEVAEDFYLMSLSIYYPVEYTSYVEISIPTKLRDVSEISIRILSETEFDEEIESLILKEILKSLA